MSIFEELRSRATVREVEDFEVWDIELPLENYEEIREELFKEGFEVTEAEYNNKKYLEIIR